MAVTLVYRLLLINSYYIGSKFNNIIVLYRYSFFIPVLTLFIVRVKCHVLNEIKIIIYNNRCIVEN